MSPDFDYIIVGSGPAGVSAAFPLVKAGCRVLMVDGGKTPRISLPKEDFLAARMNDVEQWKWMVGEDFHALKMRDAASPKLRVPQHAFAFEEFEENNLIIGNNFSAIGSMARGGLSNAWGCGVARLSISELAEFPFAASELDASYARVSQRIGISGSIQDDMSEYFGLDEYAQQPIAMDRLHMHLSKQYSNKSKALNSQGFKMGRSRIAVLSNDMTNRQACNLSGNCLWGCGRSSLYSAMDELPELRKFENFAELSPFVVKNLKRCDEQWSVEGLIPATGKTKSIKAYNIILAAGTLTTTRIVLNALNYKQSVSLRACPTAAFMLWIPSLLGADKVSGFGLGQLSFALNLHNITAFGSTFSTTGIPISEFVSHVPMKRRYGIDLLRGLMSSCVVGNLFMPGQLITAKAQLDEKETLIISGKYNDEVASLMDDACKKLRKAYWSLGAILLPKSFTVGRPGSDIHYAATLPMRKVPSIGETSTLGEVAGLKGVFVVDGACLPSLSEKSHTLTIMANADRIASCLLKRSK